MGGGGHAGFHTPIPPIPTLINAKKLTDPVGDAEGADVGAFVGSADGSGVGAFVGAAVVGFAVGSLVGAFVGAFVGDGFVGSAVGSDVGALVGDGVGSVDGAPVGGGVGGVASKQAFVPCPIHWQSGGLQFFLFKDEQFVWSLRIPSASEARRRNRSKNPLLTAGEDAPSSAAPSGAPQAHWDTSKQLVDGSSEQ